MRNGLDWVKHESRKTGLEDVVTVRCKKLVTVQADNSESFRERLGPIYNLKVESSEFVNGLDVGFEAKR